MKGRYITLLVTACAGALVVASSLLALALRPIPETLSPQGALSGKRQILDRLGAPLSFTFSSGWNTTIHTPLHRIPATLQRACLEAEDRRFFEHSGVDWRARAHAIWQNARAGRIARGASTISEQVVRMMHPRPRTVWTRVIEGIEAQQLEKRFSKAEIFEFYLNQVPFAGNRRGVAQASRYFWDRDLDTLTEREQLALAVMLRAPEKLSLHRKPQSMQGRITTLAARLVSIGALPAASLEQIASEHTDIQSETIPVRADHFVRYLQGLPNSDKHVSTIHSTLDSTLQAAVQQILEGRLKDLAYQQVRNGAVLVVDNATAEVLAWVNAAGSFSNTPESQIDAVITPRQPGSTLKPFLYGLALSRGWSAATTLLDSPLAEAVGAGLHSYRNYSRVHYGPVSLRDALGNSLNIPAIRAIHFTGIDEFLTLLRSAGFSSLTQPADFYGEGLALGNGEVTLLELVRGYLMLAKRGEHHPLIVTYSHFEQSSLQQKRIFDNETASIISNILSDPYARRLEFGSDGLLRFPVQTAIKTGTSSDYRDAWAIGYSDNFTVGVWMGNLDRSSMSSISGARGPALVLRSVFALLEQRRETRDLYLSPRLTRKTVCASSGAIANTLCPAKVELFVPGSAPKEHCTQRHLFNQNEAAHIITEISHDNHLNTDSPRPASDISAPRITMPTPGLRLAMDPRVPDSKEAFAFELAAHQPLSEIQWIVDGIPVQKSGSTVDTRYLWPLSRGRHTVSARVLPVGAPSSILTKEVEFWVR